MPRYYLHIHDGEQFILDPEGSELAGLAAVRKKAVAGARELMSEGIRVGEDRSHWRFEIADEHRAPLLMVRFSEAIERRRHTGRDKGAAGMLPWCQLSVLLAMILGA